MNVDKNKKVKKIIVNGLTMSRIIGTIIMPILYNFLSAHIFIMTIGLILFTDCLDGLLARKWNVSTIFGSLLDMTADKLFGVAILTILSTMYPFMLIPLLLEIVITGINVISIYKGAPAKSSQLGRIKMWVMGLSICTLLCVGMAPELIQSLNNIEVSQLGNNIIKSFKNILERLNTNKNTLYTVAKISAITSETVVATDYTIKSIKQLNKKSKKYKISELIKSKKNIENLKDILFDENYYKITKDKPFFDKMDINEYKKHKILSLEKNKKA